MLAKEPHLFPLFRGAYRLNYSLAHLTWLKVGGEADIFCRPYDFNDLMYLLQENNQQLPVSVIGAGSNLIIRDQGVAGIVIKLGQNFTNIEFIDDHHLSVGAGCLNHNLAKFCYLHSIQGLEFLSGIPGTIGGGIAMNAGAYGREFKDIVVAVEMLDMNGNKQLLTNQEIGFRYRGNQLPLAIFTKVIFKAEKGQLEKIKQLMADIQQQRLLSQPINQRTAGSIFANPPGLKVWQLIEQAGLRGKRVGGAGISNLHCNFLINHDNATASEIEELGNIAYREVKQNTGIELAWEVKRIGRERINTADITQK